MLKMFAVKLCLWETSSRCLFWSTEFFLGESHILGFILDLLQDLIRGWWVKNQSSPPYSYKFMVYPSLCIYSVGVGFLVLSGGIQVTVSKMTTVYNNPLVIGSGICKEVVTPCVWTRGCPSLDTLFMVFEEDYRFFPEGQDPDGCDDYGKRLVNMIVDRAFTAAQGSGSPPPQSPSPSSSRGKSSGKGGKPKPDSRFHLTFSRGSSNLQDEVSAAGTRRGERRWLQWWRLRRGLQLRKFPAQERLPVELMQRKVRPREGGYVRTFVVVLQHHR